MLLGVVFLVLTLMTGFMWLSGATAVIVKVLTVVFALLTVLGFCGAFGGSDKGRGTPPPPSSTRRY